MKGTLQNHFHTKQASIGERMAAGKELRIKFPRTNQGEYIPSPNRADPVSILEEQAQGKCTFHRA